MQHPTTALSLILILAAASPFPVAAQTTAQGPGDLLVSPGRVVFDMRNRTTALNLSNTGASEATYRISLVRMEMDADGGLAEVPLDTAPGAVNLPGLIRYSPREVTLAPGEAQTIRLQVRKPADLPNGEYRIHVKFQAVPPVPEPPKEADKAKPPKGISIKLIPVYGLAIPAIVRQGETAAKASLSDLAYDPASHTLRFQLGREGNQSVYGGLKARWTPRSGAATTVGEAAGVAVYVPNAARTVALPLAMPKGATALGGGRLKLTYALPSNEGGKVLAEATLEL
jgi:hypothetical protein